MVAVVSERAGYPPGVLAYVFKDDVHRTNHSEYPPRAGSMKFISQLCLSKLHSSKQHAVSAFPRRA